MSEAPYSPAEPPADDDRTGQVPPSQSAPRYSASASVPVPPPSPQQQPQYGQAAPYGQGAQIGQPPAQGQQPGGQQPSQPATGQARVAASASVPVPPAAPPPPAPAPAAPPAPPGYGAPPQAYHPPGGLYGQQPGPGQFGGPPPMGTAPMGAPPMGSPPGMQPMGQGGYQPSYGQPQQPERPRENPVPTGGWPYVDSVTPARKSRKGLIITLIIVAVLLVVGVGGYVGWSLTTRGSDYVVGACVKQEGSDAVVVECSTAGSFRITSIEDNEADCPDANQPTVVLSGPVGNRRYACLAPATG